MWTFDVRWNYMCWWKNADVDDYDDDYVAAAADDDLAAAAACNIIHSVYNCKTTVRIARNARI